MIIIPPRKQTSVKYPGDGGELIEFDDKEQDDNAPPELTSHIEDLDRLAPELMFLALHRLESYFLF